MTLRTRTLIIIGMILIALIVVLYAVSSTILLGSFTRLERQNTRQNVQRVLDALLDDIAKVDYITRDWARWDETYDYIEDGNEYYVKSNLNETTISELKLNVLVYIHSSGRIVSATGFDLKNMERTPVPGGLHEHLSDNSLLLQHTDTESSVEGILLLPENPMIIASRPIVTGDGKGPIRGTLIMGRYLDATEVEGLAKLTHLSLTTHRFDTPQMPYDFQMARTSLTEETPIFIQPLNENSIAGYALLKDIYGEPALLFRVDVPRVVYEQGKMSLRYFVLSLLAVGLVFGLATLLLLEKSVLSRLTQLSTDVSRIGASGDPSARVEVKGRDELSRLAGDINMMLGQLERLQHELKESEERYRALIENTYDLICEVDANGHYLYLSPNYKEALGYEPDELLGRGVFEFVHPDDVSSVVAELKKGFETDSGYVVFRYKHKNGGWRWFESTGKVFQTAKGEVRGVIVSRDITERKRIEEEVLKVQKLESLGILAGGIAHDFNNLLTAILGNISVAKTYGSTEDRTYKKLLEAEKASLRARDLTAQLLTFSKGGAPVKKLTSIGELIKDSASFAVSGSKVRCEFSMSEDLWPVEVDEGQIGQAVNNLVINSDQAMPEGGVIKVSAENVSVRTEDGLPVREGRYVRVTVEDGGIGIAGEHLSKIFDPYFTTKQRGSGLGLAVTYSIIKNHNGYVGVESELGKGTKFYIYLPALDGRVPESGVMEEKPIGGNGRVLIMDDEDVVREVAGEILIHIGYEVEYARDGNEAIEKYRRAKEGDKPFDLVIMDLTVPGGMGGKEAIGRLRDIDPGVRAVVSSGYSNDPVMSEYGRYGFKGVISKPYKIEELSKTLHDVINGK